MNLRETPRHKTYFGVVCESKRAAEDLTVALLLEGLRYVPTDLGHGRTKIEVPIDCRIRLLLIMQDLAEKQMRDYDAGNGGNA